MYLGDSTVQNFHQNNGGAAEAGAPLDEKNSVSSIKASTEVPPSSFEFYVWSDEGINLHVDLNSSQSDWTNRFRSEVHISENVHGNKFWSLRKDLGCLKENSTQGKYSFLWNTNSGQIDDHKGQDKSSSSLKLIKDVVTELNQQNKGPGTLEPQNSKPDSDFPENCALLDGSCFVNRGVVCPGASLSSSLEQQISEVASCHKYASVSLCEDDVSLDLSDPKNTLDMEHGGELVNSSKISSDNNGNNFPSLTEEWGVRNTVDGRESSECSQFDDPLRKSGLDSDDQESKVELCKKRKNRDCEVRGSSGKPAGRILRSMKNTAVVIQPRRSLRLISKRVHEVICAPFGGIAS